MENRISSLQAITNFVEDTEIRVIVAVKEFEIQSNGFTSVENLADFTDGRFFRWLGALRLGGKRFDDFSKELLCSIVVQVERDLIGSGCRCDVTLGLHMD